MALKQIEDRYNQQQREAPYGYCPVCGAAGKMRERRPNGNDVCSAGHSYPSSSALNSPITNGKPQPGARALKDTEYALVMDGPMEALANTLAGMGVDDGACTDAQIVEIAARKLQMMFDMLLATGMNENLLKAAIKS
jgi:hypothetical protein